MISEPPAMAAPEQEASLVANWVSGSTKRGSWAMPSTTGQP
jgi:hypothetical protein